MSCNIFKPKTLRILRNSVYCKFPLCISEWTCWAFQDLGEKSDKRHPSPRHAWQRCKFADCTLDFSRLGKKSTWGPAVLLLKFGRTASQNFAWLLFGRIAGCYCACFLAICWRISQGGCTSTGQLNRYGTQRRTDTHVFPENWTNLTCHCHHMFLTATW